MQPTGKSPPIPAVPRGLARHSWLWFFLLLMAAGLCAVITPLVYNLRQQLQPEQFEAARDRWKQNGPRDYDLDWEEKRTSDFSARDEFHVVVRSGQVQLVAINGRVQMMANEWLPALAGATGPSPVAAAPERLTQRQLSGYTIEGLFQTIEENLRKNAESGGKNFATAAFDPQDGHPTHYVYRVKRSPERLEWNVKLMRP